MSTKSLIGYAAAVALIGLGLLFAWAASVQSASTRLPIALLMIASGIGVIYLIQRQKPTEIVQRVEVSGEVKAHPITCPFCSASLDPSLITVVDGVPTIKCTYCGRSFQVTEEPKW
jgi:hypothetical protein